MKALFHSLIVLMLLSFSSSADLARGATSDGDGPADFVWRNTNSGETAVWFMNTSGLLEGASFPGGAGAEWAIQAVADVNHDGPADFVWRNTNNGETAVWFMNASGLRDGASFPGGAGLEWAIQAVADVNHDGPADFVWHNTNSGQTAVWLMNASGLRDGASFPGGAGLEWAIQAVADVNHDGPADFVWRNTNSGETAVWLMDTSALRKGATFPGGASSDWIIQGVEDIGGEESEDPNDIDDDEDGFTENQGDCDDTNDGINPDAPEIPGNGIDEDCDGQDTPAPQAGRENFFACNMIEADNLLQAALVTDPTNQETHFFRAMSRLLRMVEETENGPDPSVFTDSLKEMLDRFGFPSEGRSVCDFTSKPPTGDSDGDVTFPEDSPTGQEVATFLEDVALPAVMASIQENVQAIDSDFGIVVTSEELTSMGIKNEGPVEIDYGEVKLLEAGLLGLKGALLIALAYDLNFDIDAVNNQLETIDLQKEVFDANPSLLTRKDGKNSFFSQAKTTLSSG
ncbi:MAG: MopE-related protein, partial [Nitrospirales bacterium]|nr:MopE-related protein [Nitrospirales bacterium]